MDLAQYDRIATRIDTIDAALAWLDDHDASRCPDAEVLAAERGYLAAELDHIELRYDYDHALLAD